MKIMIETTRWSSTVSKAPNHIYVFAEAPTGRTAKVIAYSPFGTEPVQKFKKQMTIDVRGRTFSQVT